MDCKIRGDKYVFVYAYSHVSRQTKICRAKMKKSWEQLDDWIKNFEVGQKMVRLWDMNANVEDEKVVGIVEGWGVPGVNIIDKFLVDFCAERYFPGKYLF